MSLDSGGVAFPLVVDFGDTGKKRVRDFQSLPDSLRWTVGVLGDNSDRVDRVMVHLEQVFHQHGGGDSPENHLVGVVPLGVVLLGTAGAIARRTTLLASSRLELSSSGWRDSSSSRNGWVATSVRSSSKLGVSPRKQTFYT